MDASAEARTAADPARMQALKEKLRDLEKRLAHVEGQVAEDGVALVVFSGDLDRVMAAFVIAARRRSHGPAGEHVLYLLGAERPQEG
jgi:hypothetical protein